MFNLRTKKAMTLVELMVAVLTISVTVGIVLQSYAYHLYLLEVARDTTVAIYDLRDII
jgi:Tfp pilus assembly protein PilE